MQLRRVEEAVNRFEASPSQQGADELAGLIGEGRATPELGEHILKMLLFPRVVTRSAYPLGIAPTFSLEGPFRVRFGNVTVTRDTEVWVDGKYQRGDSGGRNVFDISPRFYSLHIEPEKPGLYRAEVRHKHTITRMVKKASWSSDSVQRRRKMTAWRASTADPNYTCQFSVPVEIRLVAEDEAEKVDLVSDAEMDAQMQKAFTPSTPSLAGSYGMPPEERRYTGGLEIKYSSLPAAVAFKAALRLPNGDEIHQHHTFIQQRRARAGTSGAFQVTPTEFGLRAVGDYHATVVLTPDPDYAYEDPAIKTLWNGTLEFPISFTVEAVSEPNTPSPQRPDI